MITIISTKEKPKFGPVNMSITFDDENEYEAFKNIMRHNISVPEFLYHSEEKQKTCAKVMISIVRELP